MPLFVVTEKVLNDPSFTPEEKRVLYLASRLQKHLRGGGAYTALIVLAAINELWDKYDAKRQAIGRSDY